MMLGSLSKFPDILGSFVESVLCEKNQEPIPSDEISKIEDFVEFVKFRNFGKIQSEEMKEKTESEKKNYKLVVAFSEIILSILYKSVQARLEQQQQQQLLGDDVDKFWKSKRKPKASCIDAQLAKQNPLYKACEIFADNIVPICCKNDAELALNLMVELKTQAVIELLILQKDVSFEDAAKFVLSSDSPQSSSRSVRSKGKKKAKKDSSSKRLALMLDSQEIYDERIEEISSILRLDILRKIYVWEDFSVKIKHFLRDIAKDSLGLCIQDCVSPLNCNDSEVRVSDAAAQVDEGSGKIAQNEHSSSLIEKYTSMVPLENGNPNILARHFSGYLSDGAVMSTAPPEMVSEAKQELLESRIGGTSTYTDGLLGPLYDNHVNSRRPLSIQMKSNRERLMQQHAERSRHAFGLNGDRQYNNSNFGSNQEALHSDLSRASREVDQALNSKYLQRTGYYLPSNNNASGASFSLTPSERNSSVHQRKYPPGFTPGGDERFDTEITIAPANDDSPSLFNTKKHTENSFHPSLVIRNNLELEGDENVRPHVTSINTDSGVREDTNPRRFKSGAQFYRQSPQRRKKEPWQNFEVMMLEEGLKKFGPRWSRILQEYQSNDDKPGGAFLPCRNPVDLKDKARNEIMRRRKNQLPLGPYECV